MLSVEEHRQLARRALPKLVFDYLDGGADDEQALRRNRCDFDAMTLTPRVLTDTRQIDTSTQVFGSTWRYPFAVAPTGLNGSIRSGGDAMLAAAAQAVGVPFTLSTASNQLLEDVRAFAPGGLKWLQLYVMEDRALAEQLVQRALAADYEALVLTVDVPIGGNRLRDEANGFKLPLRWTTRIVWDLLSHPRWAARAARAGQPRFVNIAPGPANRTSTQTQAALLARSMDRSLVWDHLRWLRRW